MTPEIAARLAQLQIESFSTDKGYTFYTRGNCAAIGHGASVGSSGVMTDSGLAYLTWRDGVAYLSSHGGSEAPAAADQVEAVRRFSEDLKAALHS